MKAQTAKFALRVADAFTEPEGDPDVIVDYSSRPLLVPDGKYQAVFVRHETAFVFRAAKVFLWFRIVNPGDYFSVELYRPYRVKKLLGKPGRGGKFKLAPGSELFTMLCRVLDIKARPDRISLLGLKHCILEIKTRTVTTDYLQRDVPDWLHYSVIADVCRKLTG